MLTFANPAFLWGLLGLAAPLLIHLIQRDLFLPMRFPSVRFIRRGKMPMQRRRKPSDLLLLLLRMALFAAIVVALTRPEWQPRAAAAGPGNEAAAGQLVVIVDASASMAGWGGWSQAAEELDKLLAENRHRPVGLVVSGHSIATVPTTIDHAAIRREFALLSPQPVSGRHKEALIEASRQFGGIGPRTIAVISDFQHTDWQPGNLPELAPSIDYHWIPVGLGALGAGDDVANVAIISTRVFPLPERRFRVLAEIRNFGSEPSVRPLVLRAGGGEWSEMARIEPGETATVSLIAGEPPTDRAELWLEGDDAYPLDDRIHLWLGHPPPMRVLAVAPLHPDPGKIEELFFLTLALETRGEEGIARFTVERADVSEVNQAILSGRGSVFLPGVAPYLEPHQWSALRSYAEEGGQLIFTPGAAISHHFALLRERGFIDASFAGLSRRPSLGQLPPNIDWINPESPLGSVFRDEAASALHLVSLYEYARLQDVGAVTLLRAGDGSPLLVEQAIDRGRALATAFPFQIGWTDLPLSSAFLPLVHELASGRIDLGSPIEVDAGASPAILRERLPAAVAEAAAARIDLSQPGISLSGEIPVIVNVPRGESIAATVSTVDLAAAIRPGGAVADNEEKRDPSATLPLWHWLAIAALCIFLAEIPLSARLRRGAPQAALPDAAIHAPRIALKVEK